MLDLLNFLHFIRNEFIFVCRFAFPSPAMHAHGEWKLTIISIVLHYLCAEWKALAIHKTEILFAFQIVCLCYCSIWIHTDESYVFYYDSFSFCSSHSPIVRCQSFQSRMNSHSRTDFILLALFFGESFLDIVTHSAHLNRSNYGQEVN